MKCVRGPQIRRPRMSGRRMPGTSRLFPRHFLNSEFSLGNGGKDGTNLNSHTWPGTPRRPSWLDLAFLERPDFQSRGPQIPIFKGFGTLDGKSGRPKNAKSNHDRSNPLNAGPACVSEWLACWGLHVGPSKVHMIALTSVPESPHAPHLPCPNATSQPLPLQHVTLWHKIITYEKLFWNNNFGKLRISRVIPWKCLSFLDISRARNASTIMKNNSQGIIFVIISCQRVLDLQCVNGRGRFGG